MTREKVCVLLGGDSPEREISLKSGKAVINTLIQAGFRVSWLDPREGSLQERLNDIDPDKVFIALHGGAGEDGTIQSLLEQMKIPFTGSGSKASKIAMDKVQTKELLQRHAILVPRGWVVSKIQAMQFDWTYGPFVVKPVDAGSSVGLSILTQPADTHTAIEKALQYSDRVLVEQYIKGRELTVGVFKGSALPVVEIVAHTGVFDFQSKYTVGATQYFIPAPLSEDISQRAQTIALQCHTLLGCRCFSRVDMIYGEDGNLYVLEVNTIPGMTNTSLLPKALNMQGVDFMRMCTMMLEHAGI